MLHQPIFLPEADSEPKARQSPAFVAAFLLVCALFLYWDAARSPIVLWDESRNIVSALEMRATGFGLVTTYGFSPDLWNTKPPLLIWLLWGSVGLFGPSVWALRVPSMAASLGTLLLTFLAARRATGSDRTGYAAGAILLLSPCFYSIHGARTADYDALLTFFTTFYLFALYRLTGQRSPKLGSAALTGLAIAAAVLTKSVAGVIPLSGVALWLLVTGRSGRVLRSRRHWLIALSALAPALLFYALREAASPGYLAAAAYSDVLGRFRIDLIRHGQPFAYYARLLLFGWFFLGPLLLLVPLGLSAAGPRVRSLATYCLCVAGPPFVAFSLAATKLQHYLLPLYPLLAVASAMLLPAAYRRLVGPLRLEPLRRAIAAALIAALLFLGGRDLEWRFVALPALQAVPSSHYGELFEALQARGYSSVSVVDEGFTNEGVRHYNPVLRAYQLLWRERGFHADRGSSGPLIASCDPKVVPTLSGTPVVRISDCLAVRLRGR